MRGRKKWKKRKRVFEFLALTVASWPDEDRNDDDDDDDLEDNDDDRSLALDRGRPLAKLRSRLSLDLIPASLANYHLQPEIDYGSHYVWLYLTPAIFVSYTRRAASHQLYVDRLLPATLLVSS